MYDADMSSSLIPVSRLLWKKERFVLGNDKLTYVVLVDLVYDQCHLSRSTHRSTHRTPHRITHGSMHPSTHRFMHRTAHLIMQHVSEVICAAGLAPHGCCQMSPAVSDADHCNIEASSQTVGYYVTEHPTSL